MLSRNEMLTVEVRLCNVTLNRLSPSRDLPNVDAEWRSGSPWLLAGVDFQTVITAFAVSYLLHLSVFQLICLSLLFCLVSYFSVHYSWQFLPCQMMNTLWYGFLENSIGVEELGACQQYPAYLTSACIVIFLHIILFTYSWSVPYGEFFSCRPVLLDTVGLNLKKGELCGANTCAKSGKDLPAVA